MQEKLLHLRFDPIPMKRKHFAINYFFLVKIKNLTSGVTTKTSYTEVSIKLEDLMLTDLNSQTIHTKILSFVGSEAITVQFVLFNLEQTSEYNKDNMKVDVTMGCAKIIYMNWFVTSVLNFFDHFQTAQERIREASLLAAETARQNVVSAYKQATRVKMNIKIKAPIIIIPVHSRSLEGIVVDFGKLKISNVIKNLDVKNNFESAVVDDIKVELSEVKLYKVLLQCQNYSLSDTNVPSQFCFPGNFGIQD